MKHLALAAIIIMASLSGCVSSDQAGASREILSEAGIAYQDGSYDKAALLYESVLSRGLHGGSLYYDLGNAYLKSGRTGKAILNYIRAADFIPRDSELVANYAHARTLMKQSETGSRAGPLALELIRLFNIFNIRESLGIFFITYYLFTFFAIVAILFNRYRFLTITLTLLLMSSLILMIPPVFNKLYEARAGAIVISQVIDVKKEPFDDAATNFPLYEGMKVYILKEGVGWVKILRPDGKVGWVSANGIEKIFPQ